MKPILQLALDFIDLKRALKNAETGIAGGVDWLEAGTPLIKSEGLHAVRELRRLFPNVIIVADMKIMDAGRTEVETAAKAGANIVDVLGASSDATIRECIQAGKNYGAKIVVDMIAVDDVLSRAKRVEDFGADYVSVHCAIDEQMEGKDPFDASTPGQRSIVHSGGGGRRYKFRDRCQSGGSRCSHRYCGGRHHQSHGS